MSKSAALSLALAATLLSGAAFAREISFEVENKTGHTLVALYGGPSTSKEWGANFLSGPVPSGDTVTISGKVDACLQDFRYDFDGAESYEEYKIDVCAISGETFVIE